MSLSEKYNQATTSTLLQVVEQLDFKMSDVVKFSSNMTIDKALKSPSMSIGRIQKQDEAKAIRCVKNLFSGISLYFDTPLVDSQTNIIALELLNTYEYRQFKLEDILLICQRLKEANIYKLTIQKILQQANQYAKDREQAAMLRSRNDSKEINSKKDILHTTVEDSYKKHYYLTPENPKKR